MIYNSPVLKMMRLFYTIPGELRYNRSEMNRFKRKLVKWLLSVPDALIIDYYRMAAKSNTSAPSFE